MELSDWKRVVDELASHQTKSVLLRGGEPFLFPGMIELLEYLRQKDIFASIDTNGTMLRDFAEDIVRIGNIHLTVSIDGPEPIHDRIRGVPGTFNRVREGLARLHALEQKTGRSVSQSLNFTILPCSVAGLGDMPDVARSLGVKVMAIVPYYYFPEAVGAQYEQELEKNFGCRAFSWRGFHHEASGVNFHEFRDQFRRYQASLGEVYDFPYMAFREDQYRTWFETASEPVGRTHCSNVEKLIDIQPNGEANFCVDFPDYSFGNVKEASIESIWNSDKAERFREFRRKQPLAVCYRCGAKYMSEIQTN